MLIFFYGSFLILNVLFHYHGLCAIVIFHLNTQHWRCVLCSFVCLPFPVTVVIDYYCQLCSKYSLEVICMYFHMCVSVCFCLFVKLCTTFCAHRCIEVLIALNSHSLFSCVPSTFSLAVPLTLHHPRPTACCCGYRAALASAHQAQPLPQTLSVLESTPQVRGMHTIIR